MKHLGLKVGDKVIVHARFSEYVSTVEKITPTGRIKVGGSYYHDTGSQIGGDIWSRSHITVATDQDIRKLEERKFINSVIGKMDRFNKNLSYEDAVQIDEILKKYAE